VIEKLIIQKTLRVPAGTGAAGDGTPIARQLDAALLDVGFSASRALLEHIGALAPAPAMDLAATVVSAVRELVGDHVQHNAYRASGGLDIQHPRSPRTVANRPGLCSGHFPHWPEQTAGLHVRAHRHERTPGRIPCGISTVDSLGRRCVAGRVGLDPPRPYGQADTASTPSFVPS
jgi:hypothetical protein